MRASDPSQTARVVRPPRRVHATLCLALAAGCGPEPVRPTPAVHVHEAPAPPLPRPSLDAFGQPYRYLAVGKLKYLETVTGGGDPDDALPIVVLLHGLGDHARLPVEPSDGDRPMRVLHPEGPDPMGEGRAWTQIRTREERPEAMTAALRHTANELDRFLDGIEARYRSPCKPILGGFSQGGSVTWAYSVLRPERPLAAFAFAAWLPSPLVELARRRAALLPPIRMMHGTEDETVPYAWTSPIVAALARDGVPITLEPVPDVAHDFTVEMQQQMAAWIDEAVAECLSASTSQHSSVPDAP